jgi:hypothetical protein
VFFLVTVVCYRVGVCGAWDTCWAWCMPVALLQLQATRLQARHQAQCTAMVLKREVYQATNDQSRFLNKNEARASFRTSANVLPHCNIRLCSYLLPHVYVSIRYDTLRTLHHGILPASISSLVKQVTDEICRSGSKEAASIGLASVRTHRCQQECWRRRSKCTLCETQSTPGMFSVDIDRLLSSRQHYNSTNRVVIGLG